MRAVTAAALLALAAVVAAQQSSVNPMPPLSTSDFLITTSPILQPWTGGSSASEGSSTSIGNSVARLTYGPCGIRTAHWHAYAWELLTPVSPTLSLTSVMISPSNAAAGGNLQRTDVITPGQSLTIPAGYLHLQMNLNCEPLDAVLVWNAVSSGGTINAPQNIAGLPASFTDVAWVTPLPAPAGGPGTWLVEAGCAAACGLPTNGTTKVELLKNKVQMAAGLIPSAEQVLAAKEAALFGKGVKDSVKESVASGFKSTLASVGANKTALG